MRLIDSDIIAYILTKSVFNAPEPLDFTARLPSVDVQEEDKRHETHMDFHRFFPEKFSKLEACSNFNNKETELESNIYSNFSSLFSCKHIYTR